MNIFNKTKVDASFTHATSFRFHYVDGAGRVCLWKNHWIDLFIDFIFLCLLVFNSVPLLIYYGRYIDLVSLIILIVAFSFRKSLVVSYSYFTEECIVLMHLFGLYSLLSLGWALNIAYAYEEFVKVEKIFVLLTLFYVYYRGQRDGLVRTQRIIECAGIIIALVYVFSIGIDGVQSSIEAEKRLLLVADQNDQKTNVNLIAMLLLIPFASLFTSLLSGGFKLRHLFFIPIVLLILASGSRKGLVGLCTVVVLAYMLSMTKIRKKGQFLLILSVTLVLLMVIAQFDYSSLLNISGRRFDQLLERKDASTLERLDMLKLGWKIFLSNPLVGCGIGCPRVVNMKELGMNVYLHNDLIEILAGCGLIGFFIYYLIFFKIGFAFIKSLLSAANQEVAVSFVYNFIVFILVMMFKMGAVTYSNKVVMFMTLPVFLCYASLRERRRVRFIC